MSFRISSFVSKYPDVVSCSNALQHLVWIQFESRGFLHSFKRGSVCFVENGIAGQPLPSIYSMNDSEIHKERGWEHIFVH